MMMAIADWETNGIRNGHKIFCPSMAYGNCPYCDQTNVCHIHDPMEECDDFQSYYDDWEEWDRYYTMDSPCAGCHDDCFKCGYIEFVYD